jgi:hypothetical protein
VFSKATIHKGKRIKRKLKVVLTEKLMLLTDYTGRGETTVDRTTG